jgi:hypothetical protein
MARPIEPTPIIYGEDARRIIEEAKREEEHPDPKRIAFLRQCKETYRRWTEPAKVDRLIWTMACSGITLTEEQAREAIRRAETSPLPDFK